METASEKDDIFAPFEAQVQEGKHMKNKEEALKNIESEINLLLEDKSSQSGYGLNEHSMTNQIREVRMKLGLYFEEPFSYERILLYLYFND